jgi:hypothetical protein
MKHLPASSWSNRVLVLSAAAMVAVLACILVLQLVDRTTASERLVAPTAAVPQPQAVGTFEALEIPCWGCPEAQHWPLRFRTDLDLLAPLGTGPANAAEWFVLFRKPDGERFGEAEKMMARRVAGPPGLEKVVPPDDPLLLEAEPWVDQATMRYYPDVLPYEGVSTAFPNFLVMVTFARSWVARGLAAEDYESALADCRRAIRLGRLLRQEDVFTLADLIGLACIRAGAEGIYQLAVRHGDADLALVASIALGEVAPQRLLTSERATRVELKPYASLDAAGALLIRPPDHVIDAAENMARFDADRRFRCESMTGLAVIRTFAPPEQSRRATGILEDLVADPDGGVALCAQWALDGRDTAANADAIKGWYDLD